MAAGKEDPEAKRRAPVLVIDEVQKVKVWPNVVTSTPARGNA